MQAGDQCQTMISLFHFLNLVVNKNCASFGKKDQHATWRSMPNNHFFCSLPYLQQNSNFFLQKFNMQPTNNHFSLPLPYFQQNYSLSNLFKYVSLDGTSVAAKKIILSISHNFFRGNQMIIILIYIIYS